MDSDTLRRAIGIAVVLAAAFVLTRQCRRPAWWLGRRVARAMNVSHSSLTDWGLSHVAVGTRASVLDVGCGGGATVKKLATKASEGRVVGIDHSAASVAVARGTNAREIAAGRVDVQEASVSELPFADDTFDLATAVETHYYWPDLASDLREVLRVLKPGGRLAIIAETYKGRRFDLVYRPAMMLLGATYLTPDGHRDALAAAGFIDVEVSVERSKGWIRAVGHKPAVARAA